MKRLCLILAVLVVPATPAVFSPNHDLMLDTTTFGFLLAAPGGTFRVPFVGAVTSFTAEATDIAGNVSELLSG